MLVAAAEHSSSEREVVVLPAIGYNHQPTDVPCSTHAVDQPALNGSVIDIVVNQEMLA